MQFCAQDALWKSLKYDLKADFFPLLSSGEDKVWAGPLCCTERGPANNTLLKLQAISVVSHVNVFFFV